MTDQLPYERPTREHFRAIRYSIHRNQRGLSVADANRAADEDLNRWEQEEANARAADALDGAA